MAPALHTLVASHWAADLSALGTSFWIAPSMYMEIDPLAAWERLRASRSSRPGKASTGARAKTYTTALGQAQQMFRAAEAVGPKTSPLLVFYGLSQAGRAIAAAAVGLKGEEVWDTLPATLEYPLTGRGRLTPLYVSSSSVAGDFHPLLIVPVGDIPDHVVDDGSSAALGAFLKSYPGTTGYDSFARRRTGADADPNYEQRLERLDAMTWRYARHRYFFPAVAGLSPELHPLMAWWAVLYALSMLARYRPAQWANHINVEGSRHAVPIEKILEQAMEHLPVLIADTIEEVTTWS